MRALEKYLGVEVVALGQPLRGAPVGLDGVDEQVLEGEGLLVGELVHHLSGLDLVKALGQN